MKKLSALFLSLILLVGCSTKTETIIATTTPASSEPTVETTGLNVLAPKGATALPLAKVIDEQKHTVTTVDGSDVLQAALVNPEPEYDIIIAPTNLGVKLAAADKSEYKLIDILTWGNLYLVASDESALQEGKEIALFGENAVVGLVFEDLFKDITLNKTYYPSVAEAQVALLSNNADVALLAEPAATATIAKAKENGQDLQIIADLQQLWDEKYGGSYPQAGIFVLEDTYEDNQAAVDAFIDEVANFVAEANENNEMVIEVVDKLGADVLGVPNGNIASKTWNRLNLDVVSALDAKDQLATFLKLFGIEDLDDALID
ncbi:MAG: hypothetical protein MR210_01715 [Erysipelotrichaceae bacterium]|nr:hypothetical protein [Erysipelotrichaceae bacterium]MDY5252364.1 hypothetical protein [Erysipelotrichaceae bacterium]